MVEPRDVVIIGAGPAGCATAIQLLNRAAGRSNLPQVTLIDRAPIGRSKLCGGGITHTASMLLSELRTATPSSFDIDRAYIRTGRQIHCLQRRQLIKIVTRSKFDASLALQAERLGAELRVGENVLQVRSDQFSWVVVTTHNTYRTRVLVCADGARRSISKQVLPQRPGRMIALEINRPATTASLKSNEIEIDFSPTPQIAGYRWDFPASLEHATVRTMGIGTSDIFGSMGRPSTLSQELLDGAADSEGQGASGGLAAAPVCWYKPGSEISLSNLLVVGDAAGTDPYLAEGITSALYYGILAGNAISTALATGADAGAMYQSSFDTSFLARTLHSRYLFAQRIYRRRVTVSDLRREWIAFHIRWWLRNTHAVLKSNRLKHD